MDISLLLASADIAQTSTIAIALYANVPQWLVILSTKTSKNISLMSWWLWLVGSLLSVFYSIVQNFVFGHSSSLILTSTMNLVCNTITLFLIVKFRKTEKHITAVL